jgi:hypothetical protein
MGSLLESILFLEDKIEFLANKLGDKIVTAYQNDQGAGKPTGLKTAIEIVTFISDNSDRAYLDWVANKYIQGQFSLEDLPRITSDLGEFNRIKAQLPSKDINQFKTTADLSTKVDEFKGVDVKSGKEKEREVKNKFYSPEESTLVYRDKDLVVVTPKTQESACFFGKGTKWCTSATSNNQFTNYNSRGPLYIIMTREGEKYQFQFESNSFMDELDQPIKDKKVLVNKYPKLKEIFKNQADQFSELWLMDNPTEEQVSQAIIKKDPRSVLDIDNPSEKLIISAINAPGHFAYTILSGLIKKGLKINDEIMKLALTQDSRCLSLIENPDQDSVDAAVKGDITIISLLPKLSEEYVVNAINRTDSRQSFSVRILAGKLKESNRLTDKILKAAIAKNGDCIEYAENPSEELQLLAVTGTGVFSGNSIRYIKNPSEQVQLAAVNSYPSAIEHIKNPTEIVIATAIKSAKNAPNASDNVIRGFYSNLSKIKLSQPAQDLVMDSGIAGFEYIKNPTDATINKARSEWDSLPATEQLKVLLGRHTPSKIIASKLFKLQKIPRPVYDKLSALMKRPGASYARLNNEVFKYVDGAEGTENPDQYKDLMAFKKVKNPTDAQIIEAIKANGFNIKWVPEEKQTEALQLMAINNCNIEHVSVAKDTGALRAGFITKYTLIPKPYPSVMARLMELRKQILAKNKAARGESVEDFYSMTSVFMDSFLYANT